MANRYYGTGRRKSSVARVYLIPGTGKIKEFKSIKPSKIVPRRNSRLRRRRVCRKSQRPIFPKRREPSASKVLRRPRPLQQDKPFKKPPNYFSCRLYFAEKIFVNVKILREHFKNAHRLADAINQKESSSVKKLKRIFAAIDET